MATFRRCMGCTVILLLSCLATPVNALDVTLQWDANIESDLEGYLIYYDSDASGEPYDGSGAVEGVSPIDVGNVTEFTVHGLPDGQVFYFSVTAYDNEELESGYSNEVDALSVILNEGSNLISLYRQPSDPDIESVLSPITGKYSSVWAFVDNNWLAYDPANPAFSDLTTMEAGRGYWVDMNEAATLPVSGSVPSHATDLINGSNLVGYNTASSHPIADAVSSIEGQCVSVWGFMDGSWRVYDAANPAFSDLTWMDPGYGYWIDVSEVCVWTVP